MRAREFVGRASEGPHRVAPPVAVATTPAKDNRRGPAGPHAVVDRAPSRRSASSSSSANSPRGAFAAAGAVLTLFGFMHGASVGLVVTPGMALAYAMPAAFLASCARRPVTATVPRRRWTRQRRNGCGRPGIAALKRVAPRAACAFASLCRHSARAATGWPRARRDTAAARIGARDRAERRGTMPSPARCGRNGRRTLGASSRGHERNLPFHCASARRSGHRPGSHLLQRIANGVAGRRAACDRASWVGRSGRFTTSNGRPRFVRATLVVGRRTGNAGQSHVVDSSPADADGVCRLEGSPACWTARRPPHSPT